MKKRVLSVILILSSVLVSCGKEEEKASITSFDVPNLFQVERKEGAGQIKTLSYETKDYLNLTQNKETKKLNVYLPFSYDSNKQYNILYLLHGTDPQNVEHIDTWFHTIGVKNILDNLIYYNQIEPLIVVTPTFYSYGLYGDDNVKNIKEMTPVKQNSSNNFAYELRNDIIPLVESTYSTYASSTSHEDLKSSRDHRAMAGLSNGARITLNGGMMKNFDYISSFGCFSSSWDAEEILSTLNTKEYASLKLNGFYNAAGIYDFAYHSQKSMYDKLLLDQRFKESNHQFFDVFFGYHSARSWRVGLYDTLQYLFKEGK